MAEKIIPVVKADEEEAEEEEMVDPQQQLRIAPSRRVLRDALIMGIKEQCAEKPELQNLWSKFQECNDRVNSRSNTAETCEEELIDYVQVLDKCVNKDLFKRLK